MRARIAAQGFTVVALIAGVVTTYGKTNNWGTGKQPKCLILNIYEDIKILY